MIRMASCLLDHPAKWAMVVLVLSCTGGCGDPPVEPVQASRSEAVAAEKPAPSIVEAQGKLTSRVEPGTPLAESDFAKTLRGTGARFVVVQVFMEACGPCITESLHLTEKEAAWRDKGIAILGLGMDDTRDGPKAFFESTGKRVTYPLYFAPWFAQQQEVFMTPTVFVYSAGGEQLFRTDSEHAESDIMNALDTKLSELLVRS